MASVYVSGIIDLPVDKVWATARDFNGHHQWHALIADSHIEDGLTKRLRSNPAPA